ASRARIRALTPAISAAASSWISWIPGRPVAGSRTDMGRLYGALRDGQANPYKRLRQTRLSGRRGYNRRSVPPPLFEEIVMARGVNKVILVGTLGKDPEVRYSQAGAAMTSVSVATNESWKDKNGEKQERTEWHRVKFFGRLAEIAGEYLKKGGQVYIEGSLRTEKYTDKQGVEKYSTDIIANEMQMLGGRQDGDRGDRAPREDSYGGSR